MTCGGCLAKEVDRARLAKLLPWPARDAHKYSRGKAGLVAGGARYPGAAVLAATAAQRIGAGYVEVACAPSSVLSVRSAIPSLVVGAWDDLVAYGERRRSGDISERSAARPPRFLAPSRPDRPTAFLVGSGFDPDDEQAEPLVHAVLGAEAPVLVDGGALGLLAKPELRHVARTRLAAGFATVVTPHAGEAARLAAPFGLPVDDPAALARSISLAYGATAMVKGPVTYVSDGKSVARMGDGTPALAKAGTGDVLAGMTAALLAQGLAPMDACVLAATLHALAGCAAADALTDICVTAEDVVGFIPSAVRRLAD